MTSKMDDLLESVGAFGKFQFKTVIIVGLMSALTSGCIYATIFIAAEPEFVCTRIAETRILFNSTFQQISNNNNNDNDDVCQIWSQIKEHHQQNNYKNLNHTCYFDTQYYDKTRIT